MSGRHIAKEIDRLERELVTRRHEILEEAPS
jgi:hypothetical protein